MNAVAVSIGAVLGSLARWQAGVLLNSRWVGGFPLGTLLVNLLGGLLIGAALEWFGRQPDEMLKLLLVTGFLGGMTTFSAFTGESLAMLRDGHLGLALAHTASHVLGALCAAWVGMRVVQGLI
jgi:fluoride exporter